MSKKRATSMRSTTPSYTPLLGTVSTYKHLDRMTHDEGRAWLQGLRERLQRKMQRERDYLDRRAAQGTHTPTDEAYEHDQLLEAELLALLAGLEHGLKEQENNILVTEETLSRNGKRHTRLCVGWSRCYRNCR